MKVISEGEGGGREWGVRVSCCGGTCAQYMQPMHSTSSTYLVGVRVRL